MGNPVVPSPEIGASLTFLLSLVFNNSAVHKAYCSYFKTAITI